MKKEVYTPAAQVAAAVEKCWPGASVGEQCGHGGMADIYTLSLDGREEALKVINTSIWTDSAMREDRCWRAENEAFWTKKLSAYPWSVTVFDTAALPTSADKTSKIYMIRMEKLTTLENFLSRFSRDSSEYRAYVLQAVEEIANAVAQMEKIGVLSRDIKVSNILVRNSASAPEFVLSDYGIARPNFLQSKDDDFSISGTGAYIAPELLLGQRIDHSNRSDVYSLGVTLFALLLNNSPKLKFDATVFQAKRATYDGPEKLKELVSHMTVPEPRKRLSPAQAVKAIHQVRLRYDAALRSCETSAALNALCSDCEADALIERLPPQSEGAALLGAALLLKKGDQAGAVKALQSAAKRGSGAASYYLAALLPAKKKQLLKFSEKQGFLSKDDAARIKALQRALLA